jgi:hypothetical protein
VVVVLLAVLTVATVVVMEEQYMLAVVEAAEHEALPEETVIKQMVELVELVAELIEVGQKQ